MRLKKRKARGESQLKVGTDSESDSNQSILFSIDLIERNASGGEEQEIDATRNCTNFAIQLDDEML